MAISSTEAIMEYVGLVLMDTIPLPLLTPRGFPLILTLIVMGTILMPLFSIRFPPLTLALIKGLVVLFSGQGMAVPLALVVAPTPEVVGVVGVVEVMDVGIVGARPEP